MEAERATLRRNGRRPAALTAPDGGPAALTAPDGGPAAPTAPDPPGTDLGWLELQVDTLFASDARGRLLHPRGAGGAREAPPRFFFGRTRHGNLWRFAAGLPEALVAELARLAAGERGGWPLEDLPERMRPIRERLAEHAPIERTYHGPAFRFAALPAAPDGNVILLTPERLDAVGEDFAWLRHELADCTPCAAALVDGVVRSVCHTARRGARAAEAGAETAPGFRGRGLAVRAVAAWARAVAAEGLFPLYSTEFSNRASRAVAARLGLTPYGVDLHLR